MKLFSKALVIFMLFSICTIFTGCTTSDGYQILINKAPAKIEYFIGEELDVTGGIIDYIEEEGKPSKQVVLKNDMVSNFNTSTAGEKTAIVTYAGCTTTFNYTVKGILQQGDVYEIVVDVHPDDNSYKNRIYLICQSSSSAIMTGITTTNQYTKAEVLENYQYLSPDLYTFTSSIENGVYTETSVRTDVDWSETIKITILTSNSIKITEDIIEGSYTGNFTYIGTLME